MGNNNVYITIMQFTPMSVDGDFHEPVYGFTIQDAKKSCSVDSFDHFEEVIDQISDEVLAETLEENLSDENSQHFTNLISEQKGYYLNNVWHPMTL